MTGKITPQLKEDILARTNILDVVGTRVPLKKAGTVHKACCPFHAEKTPSFTVSESRQTYHCFGCGVHGNAIDFLIELDRLTFVEAVEELAARAGIDIPEGDGTLARGEDLRPLYAVLAQAADLYRRQLREHPEAARAVAYLKGRGMSGEIAARFAVGYAPPAWDFLLTRLGESSGMRERLIQTGLLVAQEGKRYDRFRDRILFPIRDRRGRVIGFGGRVLGDGQPKYLNSPETPVFRKGAELYGLYEAQQARRKLERLLVVEGYMDVIALAQFGIDYAVATLGTATTPDHIALLLRSTPELIFCFDGDRAGQEAAWKALETVLPFATGRQTIRFLFLPDGEDPDTLIRAEGREAFEQRLQRAQPLSERLFAHLVAQVDDRVSPDGRARLANLAKPLIEKIPAGIFRDMLESQLATLVGIAPRPPAPVRRRRGGAPAPTRPARPSRLALAIALLLDRPELAAQAATVEDDWRRMDNPGVAILSELLEVAAADPTLNKGVLLERWRDRPHFAHLRRLSVEPCLRDIPEDGVADELIGALRGLSKDVRDQEALRPLNRRSTAEWSDEMRARMDKAAEQARTRRR